ncbi:GntR family transcriptional regulator [Bradyrhizobium sp. 142]|uniref:GntR family transcriptional regulator n=1 Tax=Bradyrhizobium sp. 142 TaxID=2782618 RepID=UPI001FFB6B90|nr:GntR family transcriptional regulator [Bradyrhizobium sp. 142]MCK1726359.1 GntR family transcriptional regulator [Bradyrhizobium sp. 142]
MRKDGSLAADASAASANLLMPRDMDRLHVGRDNLHARAYFQLRKALMAGRFRPGQRLLLKPLAQELGVSVTPVREALLRLASERGLVPHQSRTMMVPVLSVARFREIRDIRIELEGRAAEAAANNISSQSVSALEKMHEQLMLARRRRDVQTVLSINEEFHFRIYRSSDLPVVCGLIENLWVQMGPLLTLNDFSESATAKDHPHRSILASLAARDGAGARLALANDILWASKYLEKAVIRLNQPIDDNKKKQRSASTAGAN